MSCRVYDIVCFCCRCRFSQILAPVFDKAAKKLSEEFQVRVNHGNRCMLLGCIAELQISNLYCIFLMVVAILRYPIVITI